jgi:hypothetical protein
LHDQRLDGHLDRFEVEISHYANNGTMGIIKHDLLSDGTGRRHTHNADSRFIQDEISRVALKAGEKARPVNIFNWNTSNKLSLAFMCKYGLSN